MRKIILLFLMLIIANPSFGAWSKTRPMDNEKLKDTPALIRANWDAIESGTDSALLITNAKVSASAGIVDTKLATISTAGKVNASALTSLSSTPSGAGALPLANGGTGQTTRQTALDALLDTQTGQSGKVLKSDGSNASWGYPADLAIASQAEGDLLYFDGTNWKRLAKGTTGLPLVAGASIPSYGALSLGTTNVSGQLAIANGGTGASTAQTAIDALLPSQGSNNGKFLTTNGTNASWGTVTTPSMTLLSTTTISNESSKTITGITPTTKKYLIVFKIYKHGFSQDADMKLELRRASDYADGGGGGCSSYVHESNSFTSQCGTDETLYLSGHSSGQKSAVSISGTVFISPHGVDGYSYGASAKYSTNITTFSNSRTGLAEGSAWLGASSELSRLVFTFNGTCSGTIDIYEIN